MFELKNVLLWSRFGHHDLSIQLNFQVGARFQLLFWRIHAIGWCSCRCPLETFDSAKWRFFRGLTFPLLKKCNGYRQLLHRAPPSETNLRNDQIRIQLIFHYFVPLDEVIADIGESRWGHKMKELSMFSIADTQFHYGTALNRFTDGMHSTELSI